MYDWARVSLTCFTRSESSRPSAASGKIYAGAESCFYPTTPEKDAGRLKHSWKSASLWIWHKFYNFFELNISGIVWSPHILNVGILNWCCKDAPSVLVRNWTELVMRLWPECFADFRCAVAYSLAFAKMFPISSCIRGCTHSLAPFPLFAHRKGAQTPSWLASEGEAGPA